MMRSLVVCAVLLASACDGRGTSAWSRRCASPASRRPQRPQHPNDTRRAAPSSAPTPRLTSVATARSGAIVQDKRGVIYAGTGGAVLEFDGASWRRIPLSSLVTVARSMAIDDNGRIYVGAVDELGYLEPDAKGELQFVSLLDKLPAERSSDGRGLAYAS